MTLRILLLIQLLASALHGIHLSEIQSSANVSHIKKLKTLGPYVVAALDTTERGFVVYEWLERTNRLGSLLASFTLTPITSRLQDFELFYNQVESETWLIALFDSKTHNETNLQAFRLDDLRISSEGKFLPKWTRSHPVSLLAIDYFHSVLVLFGRDELVIYDIRRIMNPVYVPKELPQFTRPLTLYDQPFIKQGKVVVRDQDRLYSLHLSGPTIQRTVISSDPTIDINWPAVLSTSYLGFILSPLRTWSMRVVMFELTDKFLNVIRDALECFVPCFYDSNSVRIGCPASFVADNFNYSAVLEPNMTDVDFTVPTKTSFLENTNSSLLPNETFSTTIMSSSTTIAVPLNFSTPLNPPPAESTPCLDPTVVFVHDKESRTSYYSVEVVSNMMFLTFATNAPKRIAFRDSLLLIYDITEKLAPNLIANVEFVMGLISNIQYRNGSLLYVSSVNGLTVRDIQPDQPVDRKILRESQADYGYPKNSLVAKNTTLCPKLPLYLTSNFFVEDSDAVYDHLPFSFELKNLPGHYKSEKCSAMDNCQTMNDEQMFFSQTDVLKLSLMDDGAIPISPEEVKIVASYGHAGYSVTAFVTLVCNDLPERSSIRIESGAAKTSTDTLLGASTTSIFDDENKTNNDNLNPLSAYQYILAATMSILGVSIIFSSAFLVWRHMKKSRKQKQRSNINIADINTLVTIPDGLVTVYPSTYMDSFTSRNNLVDKPQITSFYPSMNSFFVVTGQSAAQENDDPEDLSPST